MRHWHSNPVQASKALKAYDSETSKNNIRSVLDHLIFAIFAFFHFVSLCLRQVFEHLPGEIERIAPRAKIPLAFEYKVWIGLIWKEIDELSYKAYKA